MHLTIILITNIFYLLLLHAFDYNTYYIYILFIIIITYTHINLLAHIFILTIY